MRYPSAAKALLAVALVVTVAWKLAARADDTSYLEPALLAFLDGQGFAAGTSTDRVDVFPVIHATRGGCRLELSQVSYDGADRDLVRSLTPAGDRARFIYRGRVYTEQPVRYIVADQIWMRLLRSLGLSDHDPPVLAVMASAGCDVNRLPWPELK